jgi:hypothetical protein
MDGGSLKSEQLVLEAAYAKKDWKTLCDATLRAVERGQRLDSDDLARSREGYEAASRAYNGDGYGCGVAMDKAGQRPDEFDEVKTKYAAMLAQNGRNRAPGCPLRVSYGPHQARDRGFAGRLPRLRVYGVFSHALFRALYQKSHGSCEISSPSSSP